MSDASNNDERPCLHCLIVEAIDDFFAEYPASTEDPDKVDTDEVMTALAKTLAELTCSQDSAGRQTLIEQFTTELMHYDAEFRQQDELGVSSSVARH